MAARSMGYDVHVLDPDPACPARAIASRVITAPFGDADAAATLAQGCDVVTLEIEQIAPQSLEAAARHAPLRPGVEPVRIIQDRVRQKSWLDARGFPVGLFRVASSEDECTEAAIHLGRCIAKAATGGYDGRGQIRIADSTDAAPAWRALGGRTCLVEQLLDLELELSVLVARQPDGRSLAFPPALNQHTQGILDWSALPGTLDEQLARQAEATASAIADSLDIEGLLAVEMFLTTDGRLLVNELAPRPHNSYHASERACSTSQFEQLVRAICGLPLGSVHVVTSAAIANLLGDLWRDGTPPAFETALAMPSVRLHLYGKVAARPGRKMGHLSAVAGSAKEAVRLVLEARRRLSAWEV